MHFQKLSSLVLAVFASVVLVAPSVSSTDQPRHDGQSLAAPVQHPVADGGTPVPPVPHFKQHKTFVADGGAPVPPVPPIVPSNLVVDGGAPVPPVAKPPVTTFIAV
jgi:hypothetical protein